MFFNHVFACFWSWVVSCWYCLHTYLHTWRILKIRHRLAKEILLHIQPLGFLSQFRFTLNNTSWHRGCQRLACSHAEFKVANVHGIRHISAGKRAMTPLQMRRSHHESDFECPAFITSSRMCLELFIGSRVARKNTKKVPPKTSC